MPTTGDETLATEVLAVLAGIAFVVVAIRYRRAGVVVLLVACALIAGHAAPAQAANATSTCETTFYVSVDGKTCSGKARVSYLALDGPVVSLDHTHIASHTYADTTTNFLADPAQDIEGTLGVDVSDIAEFTLSVSDDHGIEIYHGPREPKESRASQK